MAHYYGVSFQQFRYTLWDQVEACLEMTREIEFKRSAPIAQLALIVSSALGGKITFEELLMPFALPDGMGKAKLRSDILRDEQEFSDMRLALKLSKVSQKLYDYVFLE